MKNGRLLAALAVVGVAALALSGCTTSPSAKPAGSGGTITVAEVNEVTSFNPNSSTGSLDINAKIQGYTRASFFYIDPKLNLIPDKSFGTITVLKKDPLTVKYTLAKTATWSDGTPVTANDMLLAWAIESGYYDSATFDPDSGDVTTGTQYFQYAGDTSGLGLTDFPKISDDNTSMTLTYTKPYADWKLVNPIDEPISVVAKKAGVTVKALVAAFKSEKRGSVDSPAPVNKTIRAASDFWNKGFDAAALPGDSSLYLSDGPMLVKSWEPTQSMTLVRNKKYEGQFPAQVDSIVIRFIGDAAAEVTALKNGEVDIIAPQADADTLKALQGAAGITTLTGNQFSYDHLDLSFNTPVFKDLSVRQAFLKAVPRQQIIDAIVKPLNPKAEVYDSQLFFPGSAGYDKVVKENGANAYDKVDIAGAKTLLAGATPTVRVMYNTKNPNRVNEFQALQASEKEAGFNIVDGGDPNWGNLLGGAGYDAVMFGWISSGVGVTTFNSIFSTGAGQNFNGYSNATVDKLFKTLTTTVDTAEQDKIQIQIDDLLWKDAYGAPLWVAPGVYAYNSDKVSGVKYYPGQAGIGWNFWEWTKKSANSSK